MLWVNQLFGQMAMFNSEVLVYQRVSDVGVGLWHGVYHLPLMIDQEKTSAGV